MLDAPLPRYPVLDAALPRSVIAALWLPHLRDLGSVTRAAGAITGEDEPHVAVVGRAQLNLPALFSGWVPVGISGAALPVPGSLSGVPAEVAADALEAGECLVVQGRDGTYVAVPSVTRFGSDLEPGYSVSWRVSRISGAERSYLAAVGSMTEARAALTEALLAATDALARLDVARWTPQVAGRIADLGSTSIPAWPLPPDVRTERLELLARAARLLGIVALAGEEDPTLSAVAAEERASTLREVATAARAAMSAATVFVR